MHPTQVYESLVGLFLFALLMLIRKYRTFSGQVFLGWVLGYGILRPLIEIVRDDDQRGNVGPLSTSQFIGIMSVVLGLVLLVSLLRKYRRDPEGSRLWLQPGGGDGGRRAARRREATAAASAASGADEAAAPSCWRRRSPSLSAAASAQTGAPADASAPATRPPRPRPPRPPRQTRREGRSRAGRRRARRCRTWRRR